MNHSFKETSLPQEICGGGGGSAKLRPSTINMDTSLTTTRLYCLQENNNNKTEMMARREWGFMEVDGLLKVRISI